MATISVLRGDTKSIQVTCTEGITPYDLTGKKVLFTVKAKLDSNTSDTTYLISKQFTTGTSSGVASFSLTHGETDITPGNYPFNIRITDTSATQVLSSKNGVFEVLQGVTNRV